MNWKPYYFYTFPLLSLLATKIDRAGSVNKNPHSANVDYSTLVYTSLLTQTDSLLFLPNSNAIHPLSRQLQLMACKVLGCPSSRETFQAKLPTSWSTGTQKQYAPYIKKWHEFCFKWEVNSYNPPLNTVLDFLVKDYRTLP